VIRLAQCAVLLAACSWPVTWAGSAPGVRIVRVPTVPGTGLRFSHAPFGPGQSIAGVRKIVQGPQGFLWLGTSDGLRRYDGYEIRDFQSDPGTPNSVSGSYITSLLSDRSGNLWIGSDEFVDRYDPATGHSRHFGSDSGSKVVYNITRDRQGALWLATESGLKRLDLATSQITGYRHQQDGNLSLASDLVRSTLESREGKFWVVTTEGLDLFDRRTGGVTRHVNLREFSGSPLNLSGPPVSLFEDHAGLLWIAFSYGDGLVSVDPATGMETIYSFGTHEANQNGTTGVTAILEDEAGTLWLATNGRGLLKLDRDRQRAIRYNHNPSDPDSLSDDTLVTLFEDREHSLWAGTARRGIDRFDPRPSPFRTYRFETANPNGSPNSSVSSVYQDSRGMLWAGTRGVLNRMDRKAGQLTRYQSALGAPAGLSNTSVRSIAEDRAGYLWFGTWGGGLNRLDPRTGRFKSWRHDTANPRSLSEDVVSSLLVDHGGTLWAGTEDGLNRFDPDAEQFQVYKAPIQGLSRYNVITEDSSGALWLASWGTGLHRFDPVTGQFTVYQNAPGDASSLSSDRVNTVYIDHSGIIWAGTDNGLNSLDQASHKFTSYYERDGLPNNGVVGILEGGQGDLWLGTHNGMSRLNPRTKTFTNYYVSDGLPDNQFTAYVKEFKSQDGELFFASRGGLVAFFPERVIDDSSGPPVFLTDFQLFGKRVLAGTDSPLKQSISFTRSITLQYWQNIFSFEFSALSYSDPERNRYRYKLEGLDLVWNETDSTRRFATYTTLPPGTYTFRVQATNSHGNWNEQGASVRLLILPPWWSTWWFRAMSFAAVLAMLCALYQYRLYQMTREFNARLEGRVDERLRVARDLHDTLLQSFQGVLLRFQAVHSFLPGRAAHARQVLETALDDAAQAITEAREAVQNLRGSTVVATSLARAVEALGEAMAQDRSTPDQDPTAFSVEVEGTPRNLHPILRDEVYRIAAEALRNAFHHARARRIEVEIRYDAHWFRVRVRDDGIGIHASVLSQEGRPGHWGLRGMRERAKGIGGEFELWSEQGAGTEIELILTASIAYQSYTRRHFRLFTNKVGTNS